MNLHINLLMKALATKLTGKGLVVGVSAHVGMQIGSSVKRFVAVHTYIRFSCSVCQPMSGEVTWLAEGPATKLAHKRFLSRVDSPMSSQCAGATEAPAANITRVFPVGFHWLGLWRLGHDPFIRWFRHYGIFL